ncbi:MAG: hypothetical protein HDS89_06500 [Bacteroidales bacterium]|nr:hypothetical protein [Bacteroidales bacterium]
MNFSASNNYTAGTDRNFNEKRYDESDNRSGVKCIRQSFSKSRNGVLHAVGAEDKQISFGDRLFARLVMHGRTVLEFMLNSVNDLTELWGELRRKCRGISGLAKLYLRNASRGWSIERPMMIYPEGRRTSSHRAETPVNVTSTVRPSLTTATIKSDNISQAFQGKARQLSFQW